MPDIYSLLMGAPPDAAESAQAMAEQIRRGRQAALAGALGSPGAIGAMGKVAGEAAKQDEGLLERAAESRMKSGEEAKAREYALKTTLAQIAANKPQFHLTPNNPDQAGYILGPDGKYHPIGAPDRPKPPAGGGGMLSPAALREYNKLVTELSPEYAVRSAFGQAGQQDYNAIRGAAIAIRNRQAPNTMLKAELAALAGRMATGGVPTMHTMEQFNPGSLEQSVAMLRQYASGAPIDPGMQEWAESIMGMLEGESEAGQRFVRNIQIRTGAERANRYSKYGPDAAESARRVLANYGLDREHPEGWIDPQTFTPVNFKAVKTPMELLGGGGPRRTGQAAPSGPPAVKVNSKAERDALPSGTWYIDPDGNRARKP